MDTYVIQMMEKVETTFRTMFLANAACVVILKIAAGYFVRY